MSNFVKIGKHRINLDQVCDVEELYDGMVRVYFNHTLTVAVDQSVTAYDDLKGDEAKLLLAIIDQDDDQVDALVERINGKPEIVVVMTTEQVEALGGVVEAADEVDTTRAYPINFINLNQS